MLREMYRAALVAGMMIIGAPCLRAATDEASDLAVTVGTSGLPNGLYRIRNMWQSSQYLYEAAGAGFVAYGTPAATDKRSQWAVVTQGSNTALWNAATGNFMTVAGVFSPGEPVPVSYADTSASAQWVVAPGTSAGFYTLQSAPPSACYLNLEGLAGFTQCFDIPPYWGSPQWAFELVGQVPARPAPTAPPRPAPAPRLRGYGATVPFTTYEAEDSEMVRTNGTVLAARRAWGQLTSEASGRSAVQLTSAGQYIQLRLTEPAQGMVIRYSIPDSITGAAYNAGLSLYVGGVRKRDVTLTNRFSWLYGTWSTEAGQVRWSNNPSAVPRNPHRFFDEVAVELDRPYPAGTSIRLVRESANENFASTPSVTIDLVETELIPPATCPPAGYVSLVHYGAVPNDGFDDTAALNNAMAAVTSSGGRLKGVWIPEGVFDFNDGVAGAAWNGSGTRIYLDRGISIRGAGMWRSVLQGKFAGIYARAGNVTISDLKISASDDIRDDENGVSGIEGNLTSSFVSNVWFEHTKVGLWATNRTDALGVSGCRIRDVWADGLNFHYGTSHSIVFDTHIRNTGDDGMAMWSDTFLDTSNAFIKNTVQIPNLANGIGIYGGQNNRVQGNLVSDTVDNGAGISFGTNFNPPSLSGTLTISDNALVRAGSWHHDYGYAIGALWGYWLGSAGKLDDPTVTIASNIVVESRYAGILIEEPSTGANVIYASNWIASSGTYGVQIRQSAAGTTAFENNTVSGAPLGKLINQSSRLAITGSGNNW
jgi:Pectate lyase superfamily protein